MEQEKKKLKRRKKNGLKIICKVIIISVTLVFMWPKIYLYGNLILGYKKRNSFQNKIFVKITTQETRWGESNTIMCEKKAWKYTLY